ncbi:SAM-dependent methyltransferase [Suicoccus acidiformans]|uniref:SAM-dependent methyltransferase n=1 Tax=Suicoccus acidiformans TaxID=2036206 RepID=A0A347WHM7_9LACT|nr:tRNA1(Val) (adenine(37)-N6)-methyltransferase [Suicoccus acidiformans]AXY24584.1 SAM-dependent methyltransferase [Suicoccus acidiformans]
MKHSEVAIEANERLDYFQREDIHLIQSKAFFTSSLDAILLADFTQLPVNKTFHYIDFCSGNGVIPLLLSARTQATLQGIEIQAPLVDMARRSAQLNGLAERVEFLQMDLNDFKRPQDVLYDCVTCNPPYFLVEQSRETHQLDSHAIARHEIYLTLEQWIQKASQVMRSKGKLFFVHRPERLDQIFQTLLKYHFSIHRIRFVHPKVDRQANTILVEAIYGGGLSGVKIEPPLVVHEANSEYTEEMKEIYYG